MTETEKKYKLQSSDDKVVEVGESFIKLSVTLNNMLQGKSTLTRHRRHVGGANGAIEGGWPVGDGPGARGVHSKKKEDGDGGREVKMK